MKVKKHTITASDLNNLPYIEINLQYFDETDSHYYFPKALKYINDTNATIEFLYLANDTEKNEADSGELDEWYEYLEIPSGATIVDIPKTQYIRIKRTSDTALADFIMFAYNFSTWQR